MEKRGLRFLVSKATQQRKTSSSFTQHSGRPDLHFQPAKRPNFCRNKQSRAEAAAAAAAAAPSAGFSSGARHKKRLPTAEKRHQPQIGRSDRHQLCPWPSRELSWLPAQPNSSTLSAVGLSLRFFCRRCPARILPHTTIPTLPHLCDVAKERTFGAAVRTTRASQNCPAPARPSSPTFQSAQRKPSGA